MTIKDNEPDYLKENTEELRARVLQYLQWAQFLALAYDALLNYGVNYKSLPEYKDDAALDVARKMKPVKAQEIVVNWITRLEHATQAAIRRKKLVGLNGGRKPENTNKH